MEDRGLVEKWFHAWREYMRYVKPENVWNVDEIGFMIGYLLKGTFLWTFAEIDRPILTDAHELVSMTVIEAISATGKTIAPFQIMPGVQLPIKWFDNDLHDDTVIATSPKGYITDMLALEWIEHFEKLTRPSNPNEKRVILLDGCESHFTKELYEMRNRTFKKSTIVSAWRKCGIYPFDPSVVLDQMVDPLSSLSQEVNEQDLPGYITLGETSDSASDGGDETGSHTEAGNDDESEEEQPETRKTPEMMNWNTVDTPPFNIRVIQRYQEYVALRIEASIVSGIRLTPSVARVHEKSRKATEVLMINGVTSTQEMKRLKEKNLRRRALQEGTSIRRKGPVGKLHNLVVDVRGFDQLTYLLRSIQRSEFDMSSDARIRARKPLDWIIDNDTRWLSQLYMIRRALTLRPFVEQLVLKHRQQWEQDNRSRRTGNLRKSAKEPRICLEENQLTANDWDVLEHLAKLLGFYEDAVKTLEGDGQQRRRKQGININLGWEKLNKSYSSLDETLIYYKVLALHPAFRWGYFENEWKDNPEWVRKAKQMVREVWEREYRHLQIVRNPVADEPVAKRQRKTTTRFRRIVSALGRSPGAAW
ncbi:Hypothetical protein NCS54_01492600 [Fusarium falciforme]|uniref:Hypothetical protein n=1 Tax=Fusarium falciforme TaxID=195108 RepID=UPI0023017063|nr:Hypothetical protein NCS54_01492600 [Fusarium falciforme]WAO97211.1 Hypothetical protein NCS54_01492600 [Fusarium falciforme]